MAKHNKNTRGGSAWRNGARRSAGSLWRSSTSASRRAPSALRAAAFLPLLLALLPFTDAAAVTGKGGNLTVYYASAGPAVPDGYENASVDVAYAILSCPGAIALAVQRVVGSVKPSERYWFDGEQHPASEPPPNAPRVEFTGTVYHGGRPLAQFAFLGANAANDLPLNCFSGNTYTIGTFSELLGPNAKDPEKTRFLQELTVRADTSSKTLTNPAIANAIRAARATAKREAEAAERERQARARREEEAQRAAEREREAQARREARDAAEAQRARAPAGGRGAGDYAQGDFWGSAGAPSGPGGTNYVRSTDGGYFRRGSDGQYQEISAGEYETGRAHERQQREQQAAAGRSEGQRGESGADVMARLQADQARRQEAQRQAEADIDRRFSALSQSFYAAQQASDARANIDELTRMRGNYASAEELERDYQRRLQGLREEMRNLEQASQASLRANTQLYFGDSDPAVGEFMHSLGTVMGNHQREREEREARQRLAAERERMQKEMAVRRKAMLLEMRRELLADFPDGNVPLSSHKVDRDVLYFFSYTLDPSQIENDKPAVTVFNTFAVHRRGDGTWPFKNGINDDIRQIVPGANTLMGYYASQDLANSMRDTFIKLARQSEMQVAEASYERKAPTSSAAGGQQFWGTSGGQQPGQSAPDFWGSGATPSANQPRTTDDFWR